MLGSDLYSFCSAHGERNDGDNECIVCVAMDTCYRCDTRRRGDVAIDWCCTCDDYFLPHPDLRVSGDKT